MELPELAKLRRFALSIAAVLITLVLAGVKLQTPAHVTPLGIPLIIQRPDLITLGLVIASFYAALRYIYYGMLVRSSPMRMRRELPHRTEPAIGVDQHALNTFTARAQKDVDRYYPRVGRTIVSFQTRLDAEGGHVFDMQIPPMVRVACWIENIDFLLPILANVIAVCLWFATLWFR